MNTFPNLVISHLDVEFIKPAYRSNYDGGYEIQRLKYTRKIQRFTLGFKALTNVEAQALSDFFNANQGLSFNFTHPVTNVVHIVRFEDDSLKFKYISTQYQTTTVNLKEV